MRRSLWRKFGSCSSRGHHLVGDGPMAEARNRSLEHLVVRGFSPATVWAYAFDVANFAGFLEDARSGSKTSCRPICSATSTGRPGGRATATTRL